jgi:hypothetical protein
MKNVGTTTEQTATVAEQGADVAPETTAAKKRASRKKGAPKAKKSAKAAANKEAKPTGRAKAQKGASESRSNKKAEVIALMKRAKGVTLDEIIAVTSWQRHTIRGFVSILGSKGGLNIESSKNTAGERCYRIAK